MDLFQLETFLAVAEERSFSRAATRLHRTQPAVSQAVAKLEAELGEQSSSTAPLATAPSPTPAKSCASTRSSSSTCATRPPDALTELRELHRGRLNLAANEYTCLYLLPLLDEYRRQNPHIKVAVQRTLASRIPDEILVHSVEIGVVSFRPDDPQVQSVVVYRDRALHLVANPRHPLARAGRGQSDPPTRQRRTLSPTISPRRSARR